MSTINPLGTSEPAGGAALDIALAQLNPTVGALAANAEQILACMAKAAAGGAALLLCSEHALCGAPVDDLLLRPAFHAQLEVELARLAAASRDIRLVLSHPVQDQGRCFSALSVYAAGKLQHRRYKAVLAADRRLSEERHFAVGSAEPLVFDCGGRRGCGGRRLGVLFGTELEDGVEAEAALARLRDAGAEAVLVAAAEPFVAGAGAELRTRRQQLAAAAGLPVLIAGLLGGQDELIFAGASAAIDADGKLAHLAPSFAAHFSVLGLRDRHWQGEALHPQPACIEEEIYQALSFGVADFFAKNGFREALIGFSGGIDSALVLALAVDALGAERVRTVMMASPYTAQMSLDDAREMAHRLGVRYDEIPIAPAMAAFERMLAAEFAGLPVDTTEENIQSRIRGMTLMALSNKSGAIVLSTSNKSELATGYCTLYGDMCGGLAVLKDVYKTMVFRLARWRNTVSAVIPQNIIERPPSAELRAEQLDTDSLPDYELLDPIIEAYVEADLDASQLGGHGLAPAALERILALIRRNEYKRSQAVQGLRISARSFGRDRQYPITSHYRD